MLQIHEPVTRWLTIAYVSGLVLVASLAVGVYTLLTSVATEQTAIVEAINVAGSQRTFAMRIALLASELRNGDGMVRPRLQDVASQMDAALHSLVRGNDPDQRRPLSRRAQHLYFDGPAALAPETRAFIADAQAYAAHPAPADVPEDSVAIRARARLLLPMLNQAVTDQQAESDASIRVLMSRGRTALCTLLVALALLGVFVFRPLVGRLQRTTAQLYDQATRDALTGLSNRRHLLERGEHEMARARRERTPLSAIVLDLDHFKRVNDTLGHAGGDAVLRRTAELLRGTIRTADSVGRIGGEEFALVLPATALSGAMQLADALRRAVADDATMPVPVTISLGVTQLRADDGSLADVLRRADLALYRAKAAGRDRIAAQETEPVPRPHAVPEALVSGALVPALQ